jgi:hypothetical protein
LEDAVLLYWDARARTLRDARHAVTLLHGAADGYVLFSLWESDQGGDLNGDGDAEDFVLALYRLASGAVTPLGLATDGVAWLGEHGAAMLVPEWSQGRDLNGDGDLDDRVLHTLRLSAP